MQAAYKGDTKKAQIPTTSKPKLSLLTQLRIAAQHLWPPEVKELVEKGADVNAQDAYGWTAASDPEPRISSSCQVAGTCGHLQAEADLFLIRFVTLSGTGMEGASRKTQAEQNTAARQATGQCPSSSGPGR